MAKLNELSVLKVNQISSKDLTPDGNLPFAHPQHLLDSNLVDWENCLKIDGTHPKIKAIVEPGDIIVVTKGGRCGQIFKSLEKTPFVTGQTCTVIKSTEPDLYERLIVKSEEISLLKTGTAISIINLKSISELEI